MTINRHLFINGKWWASILYDGVEVWGCNDTREKAEAEAVFAVEYLMQEEGKP